MLSPAFVVGGIASCLAALAFAAPAPAVRPTPGAHYYGFPASDEYSAQGIHDVGIELVVAKGGRRLRAARVLVTCETGTPRFGGASYGYVRLRLRGEPGAAIRRDGRFALDRQGEGRRVRLSGRFLTAAHAHVFYRVRVRLPRAGDRRRDQRCQSDLDTPRAALYRGGVPPFSGCRRQRAFTLVSTDTARVFQQLRLPRSGGAWRPYAYACLFATPTRRVALGQNYDDETVDLPRLAGTFLSYFKGETTIAGYFARLRVLDLRDPGSARTLDPTPLTTPLEEGPMLAGDLVLKPTGSIAWSVYTNAPQVEPKQLWAVDGAGQRQLDSGPGLELESLELNGSTLTWINAGTTRSATLD